MELGLCQRYNQKSSLYVECLHSSGVESFADMKNIGKDKKEKLADNFNVSIH